MSNNGRFETQDNNPNAWVGVAEGFNRDTQQVVQEFIIESKDPQNPDHVHIGIDLNGNEVFNQRR